MYIIFLTLICIPMFQLHTMNNNQIVGFNFISDDVRDAFILPRIAPDIFSYNKINEQKLYNAVYATFNTQDRRDIYHFSLANKYIYGIISSKLQDIASIIQNKNIKYDLSKLFFYLHPLLENTAFSLPTTECPSNNFGVATFFKNLFPKNSQFRIQCTLPELETNRFKVGISIKDLPEDSVIYCFGNSTKNMKSCLSQ